MSATLAVEMPQAPTRKPSAAAAARSERAIKEADSLAAAARNKLAYLQGLLFRAKTLAGETAAAAWTFIKGLVSKFLVPATLVAPLVGASKTVYKTVVNLAVTSATWVAKAASTVAKTVVRGLGWFGRKASQLIGMVAPKAGAWMERRNDAFFGGAERMIETAEFMAVGTAEIVRKAATADVAARTVQTASLAVLGGAAANYVTGGALASSVATLPVIGASLAGIVTMAPVAAIAVGVAAIVGTALAFTPWANKGEVVEHEIPAEKLEPAQAPTSAKRPVRKPVVKVDEAAAAAVVEEAVQVVAEAEFDAKVEADAAKTPAPVANRATRRAEAKKQAVRS